MATYNAFFSYKPRTSGTAIISLLVFSLQKCHVQPEGSWLTYFSCGVITQYADFQRQHIVQLSPIPFNYLLWILHKVANGYTEVCSQKAESCLQGFLESVTSTIMYRAINSLLPHQSNYPFTCPAVRLASTMSCSGEHCCLIRHNEKYPSMLPYFKYISLGCIPSDNWSSSHSWFYRFELYTLPPETTFPNLRSLPKQLFFREKSLHTSAWWGTTQMQVHQQSVKQYTVPLLYGFDSFLMT